MGDHKSRKGADILGRESMDAGNDRKVGMGDNVRERPVRWAGPVGLGASVGCTPCLQQKELTSICSNRRRVCKCIHFLLSCAKLSPA